MKYTPLFLDKLRKGDQKSYEQLYHDLYPSLLLFAKKYVGDDAQSEDIVQEVFITLWNNASQLSIHTSLKSYLYSAVRNAAINFLEKKAVEEKRKERHLYPEDTFSREEEDRLLSQDVYHHLITDIIRNLNCKTRANA